MSVYDNIYKKSYEDIKKVNKFNNDFTEFTLYDIYQNTCLSSILWMNLPESVYYTRPEMGLFYNGQIAVFNYDGEHGMEGVGILPCHPNGLLRQDGFYSEYIMFAYNGLQYRRKFEDIVVIENSPNALPTNLILSYYIDRLSKSITTIDTNIIKSRGGDIFEVENPKQAEEVAKFWDNLKNNIPFSTVINKNWSNKNINKISVFNNSETDILSQYQIYKNILHEMFTVLGFNNNEQDKKERQISDEVNSNNDVINHSFFESMVLSRMDGIRRANEKFGLNMYIVKNREPARDLITEIIEEEISQSEEISEINEEIISTDNTETVDIKEEEVKEEE